MPVDPVWITLTGITATGFHGVLDHERRDGQPFSVDVRLATEVDLRADTLDGTVNYAQVAELVAARIAGEPVQLIETLAGAIADDILDLKGVQSVEVSVHKPQAPIPVPCTDVAVTVIRSSS